MIIGAKNSALHQHQWKGRSMLRAVLETVGNSALIPSQTH